MSDLYENYLNKKYNKIFDFYYELYKKKKNIFQMSGGSTIPDKNGKYTHTRDDNDSHMRVFYNNNIYKLSELDRVLNEIDQKKKIIIMFSGIYGCFEINKKSSFDNKGIYHKFIEKFLDCICLIVSIYMPSGNYNWFNIKYQKITLPGGIDIIGMINELYHIIYNKFQSNEIILLAHSAGAAIAYNFFSIKKEKNPYLNISKVILFDPQNPSNSYLRKTINKRVYIEKNLYHKSTWDDVSPGVSRRVRRGVRRGVSSGVSPGVRPGVSSGVRPGVSSGVSSGVSPGLQLYIVVPGLPHRSYGVLFSTEYLNSGDDLNLIGPNNICTQIQQEKQIDCIPLDCLSDTDHFFDKQLGNEFITDSNVINGIVNKLGEIITNHSSSLIIPIISCCSNSGI